MRDQPVVSVLREMGKRAALTFVLLSFGLAVGALTVWALGGIA